jgi:hypothetical protein
LKFYKSSLNSNINRTTYREFYFLSVCELALIVFGGLFFWVLDPFYFGGLDFLVFNLFWQLLMYQVVFGVESGLSTRHFPVGQWTFDFPCKLFFSFFFFCVFFGEGAGLTHRGPHSTSLLSHMFGKCSILQNRTFHFELVLFFFPKWWGNQIGSLRKKSNWSWDELGRHLI